MISVLTESTLIRRSGLTTGKQQVLKAEFLSPFSVGGVRDNLDAFHVDRLDKGGLSMSDRFQRRFNSDGKAPAEAEKSKSWQSSGE